MKPKPVDPDVTREPATRSMPFPGSMWLDDAGLSGRGRSALETVDVLDERITPRCEDVDSCIRPLALAGDVPVGCHCASRFSGTEGSFYEWPDPCPVCHKHGTQWRGACARQLIPFRPARNAFPWGASKRAVERWRAAHVGRFGPAPEDFK